MQKLTRIWRYILSLNWDRIWEIAVALMCAGLVPFIGMSIILFMTFYSFDNIDEEKLASLSDAVLLLEHRVDENLEQIVQTQDESGEFEDTIINHELRIDELEIAPNVTFNQ